MKLVICVFACATIPKYKDQLLKVCDTWKRTANKRGVKVYFFLGEEPTGLVGDEYIHLEGVANDYISASLKQYLGIKYIVEKEPDFDFIHVCGTDTYIFIDNMINLIEKYNSKDNIAIGGHGDFYTINNEKVYFLSGASGFLLSRECCNLLYPNLSELFEEWVYLYSIQKNPPSNFMGACDVGISYFIQKTINTRIIKHDDKFFTCNHNGFPCHPGQVNINKAVACHNLSLTEFDEVYNNLKDINKHI